MSEEISHTKGVWRGTSKGEIYSENGDIICQCYDNPGEDESGFNVALICAAPGLARALESIIPYISFAHADKDAVLKLLNEARDLIKKTKIPI